MLATCMLYFVAHITFMQRKVSWATVAHSRKCPWLACLWPQAGLPLLIQENAHGLPACGCRLGYCCSFKRMPVACLLVAAGWATVAHSKNAHGLPACGRRLCSHRLHREQERSQRCPPRHRARLDKPATAGESKLPQCHQVYSGVWCGHPAFGCPRSTGFSGGAFGESSGRA